MTSLRGELAAFSVAAIVGSSFSASCSGQVSVDPVRAARDAWTYHLLCYRPAVATRDAFSKG
jgi:hypothetical protein